MSVSVKIENGKMLLNNGGKIVNELLVGNPITFSECHFT